MRASNIAGGMLYGPPYFLLGGVMSASIYDRIAFLCFDLRRIAEEQEKLLQAQRLLKELRRREQARADFQHRVCQIKEEFDA